MNQGTISVGATATLIVAANTNRKKLTLKNIGSATIFIGGNNSVATTTGYPVLVSEQFNSTDYSGDVYGIVATGSQNITYVEEV